MAEILFGQRALGKDRYLKKIGITTSPHIYSSLAFRTQRVLKCFVLVRAHKNRLLCGHGLELHLFIWSQTEPWSVLETVLPLFKNLEKLEIDLKQTSSKSKRVWSLDAPGEVLDDQGKSPLRGH
jgi:hypothetical protein